MERILRNKELSILDEKILDDCLRAQQTYAQLTKRRWEQVQRMMKLPRKQEKENGT